MYSDHRPLKVRSSTPRLARDRMNIWYCVWQNHPDSLWPEFLECRIRYKDSKGGHNALPSKNLLVICLVGLDCEFCTTVFESQVYRCYNYCSARLPWYTSVYIAHLYTHGIGIQSTPPSTSSNPYTLIRNSKSRRSKFLRIWTRRTGTTWYN